MALTKLHPTTHDLQPTHTPPPAQTTPKPTPHHTQQAQTLLAAIATFDPRYRDRTPHAYQQELQGTAHILATKKLQTHHLTTAVTHLYAQPQTPWNPIGATITHATQLQQQETAGQTIKTLQQNPKQPTKNPHPTTHQHHHQCPTCKTPAGQPCTNPTTGKPRRTPCPGRPKNTKV